MSQQVYFFDTVKNSYADVQSVNGDGIPIEPFLLATEDLVKLFDFLGGAAFGPVKSDMNGNIKKIREACKGKSYVTLQDMVKEEATLPQKQRVGTEGLLWLRRGLQFTSLALRRNVDDPAEELQVSFTKSYEVTLRQHHNMLIRPIFSLAMKATPYRADFYKKLGGEDLEVTMGKLKPWLEALEKFVKILVDYYTQGKYEW